MNVVIRMHWVRLGWYAEACTLLSNCQNCVAETTNRYSIQVVGSNNQFAKSLSPYMLLSTSSLHNRAMCFVHTSFTVCTGGCVVCHPSS